MQSVRSLVFPNEVAMWIRTRFFSFAAFAGVAVGLSTFAPVSRAQNTAAVEDVLIETRERKTELDVQRTKTAEALKRLG